MGYKEVLYSVTNQWQLVQDMLNQAGGSFSESVTVSGGLYGNGNGTFNADVSAATFSGGGAPSNWTPSYSAGGSMTFTSVTTTRARYKRLPGGLVWIFVNASGTTGGTADNDIFINNVPIAAATTLQPLACFITDGGTGGGAAWFSSATQINIRKADASNFALDTARAVRVCGIYEAA